MMLDDGEREESVCVCRLVASLSQLNSTVHKICYLEHKGVIRLFP